MISRICIALCVTCFLPAVTKGAAVARPVIDLDAYRQDLNRLQTVVTQCSQQAGSKAAAVKACDPATVGPDVCVTSPAGKRAVSYDWLRESLVLAQQDRNAKSGLSDARSRLLRMQQEATTPSPALYVPGNVANIRRQLDSILDSPDYPKAKPPSYLERLWQDFQRWLLRMILSAMPRSASSTPLYLLELTVIAIPCGLLIWWFVRKLTVQNLGLAREGIPHPTAPSSRPWEEWLQQAQTLAGGGQWRDAVHHVYWAAISCLESRRFWPADRTRTPREYLNLLEANPETFADLSHLTRSFEQTWYGTTPAAENDYDQARAVLQRISAR
ncbi:MAG TPA: DUF4129 domain-containing protein [Acidobacteriaceae bacterium]|nr:DUF4129 domain-containing protein [Acidobacteriaceae bacterium]